MILCHIKTLKYAATSAIANMGKGLFAAALAAAGLGLALSAGKAQAKNAPWQGGGYTVGGLVVGSWDDFANATAAMSEIKVWYGIQLGSQPLDVAPLEFLNQREVPLEAKAEPLFFLRDQMATRGYPVVDNASYVPYIYLLWGRGLGGFAGAQRWDHGAGLGALGDACLEGLAGRWQNASYITNLPSWMMYHDAQVGAIAHELGHTLGIQRHSNGYNDLMGTEWMYWPNCQLNDDQKHFLLTEPRSGFFMPPPPDVPDIRNNELSLPF